MINSINSSFIRETINTSHIMNNNQTVEFTYKRIQSMGQGHSGGISLPKKYLINMGLTAGDFVKVIQDDGRIVIERV